MNLDLPVLFINFKTYAESTGKNAIALAKKSQKIVYKESVSIVLVVQAVDIAAVSKVVKLPVFAQHIDPVSFGSNTGHILAEAVKEAGAVGTILNHAENKRDNAFIEKAIGRAKELGLIVMVCAEDIERAKQIASFVQKPDFIAVEPPELIGGDVSVSTANPELITDSVNVIKEIASEIEVITGAGIKNNYDVKKALEFGTKGVFVASGIIRADNQAAAIKDLVEGFK